MKSIGQILREKRKELGMTQSELSSQCGISINTYNHWERDKTEPSVIAFSAIADFYGCSIDELIGRTGHGKKAETTYLEMLEHALWAILADEDAVVRISTVKHYLEKADAEVHRWMHERT